ncbi:hypothetical protein FP359_24320 [Klebsiella variicola]|uniref:coiled-coil domain-containing protein n=1 Tax=Klebsiella variicola TaxID=244366 RepID=UPI001C959899|nr:hypothetical protein [Klebsiella variicola]MBY5172975.1 hypothetical protein [Klebsiella variicola]
MTTENTDTGAVIPELPQPEIPATKVRHHRLFGRRRPQAQTDGEPATLPTRKTGRLHACFTLLLLLGLVGQFVLFSQQLHLLQADQEALMRRVPAGMTQRADAQETALDAQQKTLATLQATTETLQTTLRNAPQAVKTLRREMQETLASMKETLQSLELRHHVQQEVLDTLRHQMEQETARQKVAQEAGPSATPAAASGSTTPIAGAQKPAPAPVKAPVKAPAGEAEAKKTPVATPPAATASSQTTASPPAASQPATGTVRTATAARTNIPPFELRGIEHRGGVPWAVTTLPGDMSFSSLRLLMAGQSREGWRLLRTTDSGAVFRAPSGKELSLAIR